MTRVFGNWDSAKRNSAKWGITVAVDIHHYVCSHWMDSYRLRKPGEAIDLSFVSVIA